MFDFSFFLETTPVNNLWLIILVIVFSITSLGGLIAGISTLVVFLRRKFEKLSKLIKLVYEHEHQLDDVVTHLNGVKVHYFDHVAVIFDTKRKK